MTRRTPSQPSPTDLAAQRREYLGERLLEGESPADPYELFTLWLEQALAARLLDATAMVLATSSSTGEPSARVVLLKGHDPGGLIFYTRHDTQKCSDLRDNPRASLLFHWRELDRQVRIEAAVAPVPAEDSRSYFASRPRSSQIAAQATAGLERVTAEQLEQQFSTTLLAWEGRDVAMPDSWGGFRAVPSRLEFWQGRPNRLHDRLVYERSGAATWERYRLAP